MFKNNIKNSFDNFQNKFPLFSKVYISGIYFFFFFKLNFTNILKLKIKVYKFLYIYL